MREDWRSPRPGGHPIYHHAGSALGCGTQVVMTASFRAATKGSTACDNSHDFESVADIDLAGGKFRWRDRVTVVFDSNAFRKKPVGCKEIDQGTRRRQLQGFAIGGDGRHGESMWAERIGGNGPGSFKRGWPPFDSRPFPKRPRAGGPADGEFASLVWSGRGLKCRAG